MAAISCSPAGGAFRFSTSSTAASGTPQSADGPRKRLAERAPWWNRLCHQLGWADPAANDHTVPTGFPVLDAALPKGGWPQHGLVEVLVPRPGHPELTLLAPALVEAATRQQRFGVIAAPAVGGSLDALDRLLSNEFEAAEDIPAPRLEASDQGEAEFRSHASALPDAMNWLRKGTGGVLAVWLADLKTAELRELKRTARRRHTLVFVVRPWVASWDDSEADLRVCLIAGKGHHWEIRVHPRPGLAAPTVRVPALGQAPARHLRVVRDPQDHRRALLSGTFVEVCAELDRLAAIEHLAESTLPAFRSASAQEASNH